MSDVIKDFYFAMEDKWYAGLDWLDRHGIPVYKAIDPIDTKIPSFALASGLILLGLIFAFFSVGGLLQGDNVSLRFQVVDQQSNPLPNVEVQFTINGQTQTLVSDTVGEIELLAPAGARVNYRVDVEKYEIVNKSVSAKEDTLEVIQLSELQTSNLSKTLKLVNEVGQPIYHEAQLTFACSTAYGAAPSPVTGTGGTFVVTPNANCIPLVVNVNVQGYLPVQSFPITANKDVYNIVLTQNIVRDASISVSVRDNTGAYVSGMDVSIQTNGIDVDNAFTDAAGSALFNVAAGTYTVVAADNVNSVYTSASQTVNVSTGETVQVELNVNKNAASSILVTVIDKKTNNALKDATVKLKSGTTTLSTVTTNTEGKATLAISDKTQSYVVTASKDGYIPQQQTISGSATTASFGLDKATASNAAKLRVTLLDQDNEPVADAKVVLYNADTGFLAPYNAVISDVNGVATFNAVVSGNYQAFAYKTSLTGFSSEQFFDITDPSTHLFTVRIEVPDGTVSIRVVDTQGNPVPFARVAVYNAFKNQLIGADLTDTNGTYVLPRNQQRSKADKDVYLVVSKTNYSTVTTSQKPVLPETVQAFNVVLPPTDPSGNISIELVGVYTLDGKIVTGVSKGKEYTAKFRVNIPEEHDELDTLNVHVRTGEKDIVEKDEWYIDVVKFPRSTIFKGSSWDPANGLNVDGDSATNGPGKWINASLGGPNPGVYEFEVGLRVRDSAAAQDILKLFYKLYAENGEELRDPTDANPIDELYAATKSATYQVGVTTACDSNFCFDASVLDVDEGRIEDVSEQFNGKIFTDYKLTFNLLNNGNDFHTNSNLRVKVAGEGMDIVTYDIFTADALRLQGTVNDNEFKDPLNVGNFTPQKKVGGTIILRPKTAGTSMLTLELVSDFQSVFSQTIQFNITGDKELSVSVSPDAFPSNVAVPIMIRAEDAATGEEQANALVTIENVSGIVLASKKTDAAGNAELELPAQLPGKKLTLRVEKAEYNPYVQTLDVSDKVLTLQPATLGVGMNVKTTASKTTPFSLTNETSLPIVISKMQIQGNLKGFLDVEQINAALQPYVGVTISPKGKLDAQLTSTLSPEGLAISEHEDLDAVIAIEATNYGAPWSFELPVRYALGATSEVDDPTCFSVAPKTWNTSTEGQSVTYEFTIRNNCAIGGTPSSLQNLSARVTWNGNELGDMVLSVFQLNNPTAIGAAKVRGGYFSTLLNTIPAQDELIARLDFTPYGGVKGVGLFDVEIQATNPLEGKPQLLLDKIRGEIGVVNLSDCVLYDKEIIDIVQGKKDSFTIETKGCGAPIDVLLTSELELNTKQFTLQGTDKKIIDVSDAQLDQGQYPIYVELEGQENRLAVQNKVLRARIRDPNACLQLNRYEFDVYDDPGSNTDGFDTARLDNLCVNQRVQVKVVIEKKFSDSLRTGLVAGLGMFVTTGLNNIFSDKTFTGKDKNAVPPAPTPAEGLAQRSGAAVPGANLAAAGVAAAGLSAAGNESTSTLELPESRARISPTIDRTGADIEFPAKAVIGVEPTGGSDSPIFDSPSAAESAADELSAAGVPTEVRASSTTPGKQILSFLQGAACKFRSVLESAFCTAKGNPGAINETFSSAPSGASSQPSSAGQSGNTATPVPGSPAVVINQFIKLDTRGENGMVIQASSDVLSPSTLPGGRVQLLFTNSGEREFVFQQIQAFLTARGRTAGVSYSSPYIIVANATFADVSGVWHVDITYDPKPIVATLASTFVPNAPTVLNDGRVRLTYPNRVIRDNAKVSFDQQGFSTTTDNPIGTTEGIIYLPAGTTYTQSGGDWIFTYTPPANVSSQNVAPITGFAILFQSNNGQSTSGQVQQGLLEGVGRGLISKISGQGLFGTTNPFIAFGITTLAVAAIDYFSSDDKEYTTTVLGKDVDVRSLRVIGGEKGADESVADNDIRVTESGIALNPKINIEKEIVGRIESTTLTFTNISKIMNEILFRNLLVSGIRYEYAPNQKYKNHVPDENDLKSNNEENFSSRFHLQFNTLPPESLTSIAVPPIALSCDTFSEKNGKTGANAAPRVSFEWNFNDITHDACDTSRADAQGKPAYIYCDATQFSISTIQRVQALRTFVETNAPFSCPIENAQSGIKTQPIPAADIGIASIRFDKVGIKDVNMIVGIENKSPAPNNAQVKVTYKIQGSTGTGVTLTRNVLIPIGGSRSNVGFVVSNLADGTYAVDAQITPETCENCFNSTTNTDTITSTFFIGSGNELVACEPFTTKRLDAFIEASEAAGKTLIYPAGFDRDAMVELVNYRAHLMQDRFSPDFFNDFDRYARKVSFFNAPTYYLNQTDGLYRLFTDREHWVVTREGTPINPAGYLLPGPGIYDVTLDINFSDNTMKFFKNGEPDAIVNVYVEKTSTIEGEMSPFYSLPFNGLIGTDDGQGRVGYGVNYTGEKVVVNEDSAEQVSTIDLVNSTPVATVQTSKVDSYAILNSLERGNILTLTRSGSNNLALKWSPSYATPVLMTVKGNNAQSNAYGFYSIGINGDTAQSYIGAQGNPWYGVGANCRDFEDRGMIDQYSPRYDSSAINASCALVGPQENISYGFEWCENTIHTGSVSLKTIFYTPQGTLSTIARSAYKDDLTFVGESVSGGNIPLNGTDALPGNTPGDELNSIEDILELVKQEAVCVANSGSKTEFFWNPKEVLNAIENQEKAAAAACIVK